MHDLGKKKELKQILGSAFGIAVMVGGIIGVGILRTPGSVADLLHDKWLILLGWTLGGLYVLLAVNSLAELSTMLPKAGGAFNYIQRAFGNYAGFISGWFDYIINAIAPAYFSIAISEYLSVLIPPLKGYESTTAVCMITALTLLHLAGLKGGSITQQIISVIKVGAFVILIACCFFFPLGESSDSREGVDVATKVAGSGIFIAFIRSMQLILGTYDGWGSPVFFAEENVDPGKSMPRSLFGGALIVMCIYVLINLALFHVLPVETIAGSNLAVADAARVIFGEAGYTLLILIAIFSLIGILNAIVMICPRILFGLSREGFFIKQGTLVNNGGTPYVALITSSLIAVVLVIISSFDQLFALGAFMTMFVSSLMFASVFKLRISEPQLPRPFKAWGYPYVNIFMLLISIAIFVSYTFADPKNFVVILLMILVSIPTFYYLNKKNRQQST